MGKFRWPTHLIICCRDKRDAERVQRALEQRLKKFGLELNAEKTKTIKFNKREVPAIKQDVFDFLGFTFYIRRSRKGYIHVAIKTARERFYSKLRKVKMWCKENRSKKKLLELWKIFCSKLRGHVQYYGVSLNTDGVHCFIQQATKIFFKWMNRRSQKKSFNWEQFSKFLESFPAPKAKICHRLF